MFPLTHLIMTDTVRLPFGLFCERIAVPGTSIEQISVRSPTRKAGYKVLCCRSIAVSTGFVDVARAVVLVRSRTPERRAALNRGNRRGPPHRRITLTTLPLAHLMRTITVWFRRVCSERYLFRSQLHLIILFVPIQPVFVLRVPTP